MLNHFAFITKENYIKKQKQSDKRSWNSSMVVHDYFISAFVQPNFQRVLSSRIAENLLTLEMLLEFHLNVQTSNFNAIYCISNGRILIML